MNTTGIIRKKIIIIGDAGVGKTTLITRHRTGEFERKYIATLGVDVSSLTFHTTHGIVIFDIWDCAGQTKFEGLGEEYYKNASGAIVMFDVTSKISFKNAITWKTYLDKDIPVVVCGNKIDIIERKVKNKDFSQEFDNTTKYYISAKSNYNFEKPFLTLIRSIFGNDNIELIADPSYVQTRSKPRLTDDELEEQQQNTLKNKCEQYITNFESLLISKSPLKDLETLFKNVSTIKEQLINKETLKKAMKLKYMICGAIKLIKGQEYKDLYDDSQSQEIDSEDD